MVVSGLLHDIARGVTSRIHRGGDGAAWGPGPDDYTFHSDFSRDSEVGWATIGASVEPFMLAPPPGTGWLSTHGWSPDRRYLLGTALEQRKLNDLFAWSEDEGWVNLTNTPDIHERSPTFSPDGRWIAYVASEAFGEARVHVRPFLRDGPVIEVAMTNSSAPPVVAGRHRTLLLVPSGCAGGGRRRWPTRLDRDAAVGDGGAGDAQRDRNRYRPPAAAVRADAYGNSNPIRSLDMGPDGRFLMVGRASEESIRSAIDEYFPDRIRLIVKWANTLEERSP